MVRILGLLAIFGAIGTIGYHFNRQYQLIKKLCFNYLGVKFVSFKEEEAIIEILLEIKNPSDLDVIIDAYDFDILVNNTKVANIKSDIPQKMISGRAVLRLKAIFSPKKVLKKAVKKDIIEGLLINKAKIIFKIDGTIDVSLGVLWATGIPVEVEMSLKEILSGETVPC